MTIPTRWHAPSCKTPHVVIDGNVPECRNCGSSAEALLHRAAEEPAPSYSGIKLPPETPIGQMDLWWPPCVPYTCDGAPRTQPEVSPEDAASLVPQTSDPSLSEIYTSTLGKDQFRLLYLSGARAIDCPIHGNLVEYQQDNCPEYETTSYTWGGEDGDATPCKPAYFGDFWDVLFLTRNCWSLLQYLRPEMGTRLVWVDAISINQDNIQERGAQVSAMPQIYQNCMRVVIYPGNHLVCKDEHIFRQRTRPKYMTVLGDVLSVADSDLDLLSPVLQSRYISRVWIIQELILAPDAILALEHQDLYLPHNLLHRASQKDDKRKWLEYVGKGSVLGQTTLLDGLRRTSDSQATNPRDRIFGILGILGGNPMYSGIVPDYSLSMRDCLIGAMGHTLIISREMWPLLALHTQTSDTTLGYPSWVPSLEDIATSTHEPLWTLPESEILGRADKVPGDWVTAIEVSQVMTTRWDLRMVYKDPDCSEYAQFVQVGLDMSVFQDTSIDSGSGALTLRLVRVFDGPHDLVEEIVNDSGCRYFLVKGSSSAAWFSSTTLFQKPEQPCHIFLGSTALDSDPDMMFPLVSLGVYIVVAVEAEASGTFNMVSCSRLYDALFLSAGPPLRQPFSSLLPGLSLFQTLGQTLNYNGRKHHIWREFGPFNQLTGRVSEAMLFDMIIPGGGATASGLLQLSLAAARTEEPAEEELPTVTGEFRGAYTACLQAASEDFNPVLDDEFVWFTLNGNDSLSRYWDSVVKHISDVQSSTLPRRTGSTWTSEKDIQWVPWGVLFPTWFDLQIPEIGKTQFNGYTCQRNWGPVEDEACDDVDPNPINTDPTTCSSHQGYEPEGHMWLHYWFPCFEEPREIQMPVRARMPLRKVVEAIRATELNRLHRHLIAFSEKVSEDVETLLQRGPQPGDSNIFLQDWPKSLVDELGFVWRNELVTFV